MNSGLGVAVVWPCGESFEVYFSRFASVPDFRTSNPRQHQSAVVEEPEANPGRPTVSTPATITPGAICNLKRVLYPRMIRPSFLRDTALMKL